jgi:hypothetical protein
VTSRSNKPGRRPAQHEPPYRQDAEDVGEPLLATVLDDIEQPARDRPQPSNISVAALERAGASTRQRCSSW